jgi:hypothetical protein
MELLKNTFQQNLKKALLEGLAGVTKNQTALSAK